VRQLPRGAELELQLHGPVDLDRLRADLIAALEQAGLNDPEIVLRTGTPFERTAAGKLRRFCPLGAQPSAARKDMARAGS
jgi:hypothetical protein